MTIPSDEELEEIRRRVESDYDRVLDYDVSTLIGAVKKLKERLKRYEAGNE